MSKGAKRKDVSLEEPPPATGQFVDPVKVTSVWEYGEVQRLISFLRETKKKTGRNIGRMEYIRAATLEALREGWLPKGK